jgi:choline-glycine betaine transporter
MHVISTNKTNKKKPKRKEVKMAKLLKTKGKLQSQTWLSSTGSLVLTLTAVATMLLEHSEAIQSTILAIVPVTYLALVKAVLGAIFAAIAFWLKAQTDSGREKAVESQTKVEGWYRPQS